MIEKTKKIIQHTSTEIPEGKIAIQRNQIKGIEECFKILLKKTLLK